MTDITPLYTGAAAETPKPEVRVPDEPHMPWGRSITSVQPHPVPLITAKETERAAPDPAATRQHVAREHADITGIGALVDLIV